VYTREYATAAAIGMRTRARIGASSDAATEKHHADAEWPDGSDVVRGVERMRRPSGTMSSEGRGRRTIHFIGPFTRVEARARFKSPARAARHEPVEGTRLAAGNPLERSTVGASDA